MPDGGGVTMVFNDNNRGKRLSFRVREVFIVIKQRNNRGETGVKQG